MIMNSFLQDVFMIKKKNTVYHHLQIFLTERWGGKKKVMIFFLFVCDMLTLLNLTILSVGKQICKLRCTCSTIERINYEIYIFFFFQSLNYIISSWIWSHEQECRDFWVNMWMLVRWTGSLGSRSKDSMC